MAQISLHGGADNFEVGGGPGQEFIGPAQVPAVSPLFQFAQRADHGGHAAREAGADQSVGQIINFGGGAFLRDRLNQEKKYLEEEINLEHQFEDIVGESAGLRQVLMEIETVAPTDATVLIQGETGTGKELLARAIHRLSPRNERTFIKLNCAAIPAGLLESELFGHEKGAFTGAITRKMGRLELAHEGSSGWAGISLSQ